MKNDQRPSPSEEGHHGEMQSPDMDPRTNARRAGLFPPNLGPMVYCGEDEDALSEAASDLAEYIRADASGLCGESFKYIFDLLADLRISRAVLMDAADELVRVGALESYQVHKDGCRDAVFLFVLPVDLSPYYGDDENPEADWSYDLAADVDCDIMPAPPKAQPKGQRARVYAKTNGRCFYCIEREAKHLDHMMPKVRGGGNEDANLIGACRTCNIQKNDRTVEEYRAYLAYRNRLPDISMVRFYGERFQ